MASPRSKSESFAESLDYMSSGRSLRLTQYRSDSQKLQEFTQKFETQQINSSEAVYMTQDIQSIAIENPVLNAKCNRLVRRLKKNSMSSVQLSLEHLQYNSSAGNTTKKVQCISHHKRTTWKPMIDRNYTVKNYKPRKNREKAVNATDANRSKNIHNVVVNQDDQCTESTQSKNNDLIISVRSNNTTLANRKRKSLSLIKLSQSKQKAMSPSIFSSGSLSEALGKFGVIDRHSSDSCKTSSEEITNSQLQATLILAPTISKQDAAIQANQRDSEMLTMDVYTQTGFAVRAIGIDATTSTDENCKEPHRVPCGTASQVKTANSAMVSINEHYLFDRYFTHELAIRTNTDENLLRHTIFDLMFEQGEQESSTTPQCKHYCQPPPSLPHYGNDIWSDKDFWTKQEYNQYHENRASSLHIGWTSKINELTSLTYRLNTSSPVEGYSSNDIAQEFEQFGCNLSPVPLEEPLNNESSIEFNAGPESFPAPSHNLPKISTNDYNFPGALNVSIRSTDSEVINGTFVSASADTENK